LTCKLKSVVHHLEQQTGPKPLLTLELKVRYHTLNSEPAQIFPATYSHSSTNIVHFHAS